MISRRRFLQASGTLMLTGMNPSFTGRGGLSIFRNAFAVVDPVTVITVGSAAIGVIRAFSASSDGGLLAMMQAQQEMLRLISKQIDGVIDQLGNIRARIAALPEDMRRATELDRLIGYFDEVTGASEQFVELNEVVRSEAQNPKYTERYRDIADRVNTVRTKQKAYCSLVPALSLPLALGVEVGARRRSGENDMVGPALRSYDQWARNMLNTNVENSLAWTLDKTLLPKHAALTKQCSGAFVDGATDCAPPIEKPGGGALNTCFTPYVDFLSLNGGVRRLIAPRRIRYSVSISAAASDGYLKLSASAPALDYTPAVDGSCIGASSPVGFLDTLMPGPDIHPRTTWLTDIYPQHESKILAAALQNGPTDFANKTKAELDVVIGEINIARQSISAYASTCEIIRNARAHIAQLRRDFR